MKTKLTVRLDSEIVKAVRVKAAEEGISVSEFLAAQLSEIAKRHKSYARAKKSALARLRNCRDLGWVRPASRDELHNRQDRPDMPLNSD